MTEQSNLIGKRIGSYRLVNQLSTIGGFGSVYLGKHIVFTNRPIVAIKILYAHLASEQEKERFLQEARFLDQLKHPHILPIIEAGIEDGLPFLIVEYAANGSLKDRLQKRALHPLPLEEALTILSQIGQALQYAHHQNIVHRDLKPDNILFNTRGEALLADFGIATVLDAARTKPVDSIGSPPYMAPELFDGIASMRSDQYALGCIAYELMTGRKPFLLPPGASWLAWGYKHLTEVPLAPTRLHPHLPMHIEQAILKALAKDCTNRHRDISTFITALMVPG